MKREITICFNGSFTGKAETEIYVVSGSMREIEKAIKFIQKVTNLIGHSEIGQNAKGSLEMLKFIIKDYEKKN